MNNEKWTLEQLDEHLRYNVKDYGSMVVVSALYKKIYGEYPSIGLSGFQAECIENLVSVLPDVSIVIK